MADNNSLKDLPDNLRLAKALSKTITIRYPLPSERIEDCRRNLPRFSDLMPVLNSALKQAFATDRSEYNIQFIDFPACILDSFLDVSEIPSFSSQNRFIPRVRESFLKDKRLDYLAVARDLCLEVRTQPKACDRCMLSGICQGIFKKYMRLYGAGELIPRRHHEIRLTTACNQSCIFCNTRRGAENIITKREEIEKKMRQWSGPGFENLVISGGEPGILKDLPYYVALAKRNSAKQIELQSNAVLITAPLAKQLKDAGLTKAFVSLHAIDEAKNTLITKTEGNLQKTIQGIRNLIDNNIRTNINLVVNSYNYMDIPHIVGFCHEKLKGFDTIVLSFVAPLGSAQDNAECIPRISDTLPYIRSAIDYCVDKSISVRIPARCGIPLCYLPGYESFFDSFQESIRWSGQPDKVKLDFCDRCRNTDRCSGQWLYYTELHGAEELEEFAQSYVEGEGR